jgi:hypothetical protein
MNKLRCLWTNRAEIDLLQYHSMLLVRIGRIRFSFISGQSSQTNTILVYIV